MKVKGSGTAGGVGKASSSKKGAAGSSVDGASFGSMLAAQEASGADASGGAAGTQVISNIDVLLMAQAAEDPTQGQARQRMKRRSLKILDALDAVRDKMLGGRLTVGDMIAVADMVAAHREAIDDPVLSDLMDEVDLRAQVEIAKMQVAMRDL